MSEPTSLRDMPLGDALATIGDRLDRRFDVVDAKFDAIDRRFEQVDRRFEQVDQRFEQVDQRFDMLTAQIARMQESLTEIAASQKATIDIIHREISPILRNHERRIGTLEEDAGRPHS